MESIVFIIERSRAQAQAGKFGSSSSTVAAAKGTQKEGENKPRPLQCVSKLLASCTSQIFESQEGNERETAAAAASTTQWTNLTLEARTPHNSHKRSHTHPCLKPLQYTLIINYHSSFTVKTQAS